MSKQHAQIQKAVAVTMGGKRCGAFQHSSSSSDVPVTPSQSPAFFQRNSLAEQTLHRYKSASPPPSSVTPSPTPSDVPTKFNPATGLQHPFVAETGFISKFPV